nr:Sec-independent protein translocase TatB [Corynebacterium ammoniagenes]
MLALIIIGPERLPNVIQDVRAAIFAARKAINNAKKELNGDFEGLGQEFDAIREPLSQAAEWGRLGPRAALTKALFDGDDSAWDDFNPKKLLEEPTPQPPSNTAQPPIAPQPNQQPPHTQAPQHHAPQNHAGPAQPPHTHAPQHHAPQNHAGPAQPPHMQHPPAPQQYGQHQGYPQQAQNNPPQNPNNNNQGYAGGGFSWADIT